MLENGGLVMKRSNERTLGAKGTVTVPKDMRVALGLTGKTSVEFVKAKDADEITILRYKKHCVTCGRIAKNFKKINGRYVCEKCTNELMGLDYIAGEDLGDRGVVDNLIIVKKKIEDLKKELAEYENELYSAYELGKTTTAGSLGSTLVYCSSTVKEPTRDTYEIIREFMNPNAMSYHLEENIKVSYFMSAKYKNVVTLLKHGDYITDSEGVSALGALEQVVGSLQLDKEQEPLVWQCINKWSDKPEINRKNLEKFISLQDSDFIRLNLAYNWFRIKEIFPGVNCNNIEQLKDALMLSDVLKINTTVND